MHFFLALWRFVRSTVHVLKGVLICLCVFPFKTADQRAQHVHAWARQLIEVLGMQLTAHGAAAAPGPVLVVANHISWLDIMAINAVRPVRFVSKADVRRWPVLGTLVAGGGTLFIERERKRDALRVVHQVREALMAGDVVALFPEGTTSDGHGLLAFHANLLQAAVVAGTPIQPMALRYRDARERVSSAAAYVGEMNLLQSIWAVVSARDLHVDVELMPPLLTAGGERRVLAEQARSQIQAALDRRSRG